VEPAIEISNSGLSAAQLYLLGRYYQGRLRNVPALEAFKAALVRDPQYFEAYNALGALYCEQGRIDEGIAAFEQALRLSPSAAHVQNNLGYGLILAGRYPEAVSALQRAVELDSGNTQARSNLSLALVRGGLSQDALDRPAGPKAAAPSPVDDPAQAPATPAASIVVGADEPHGAAAFEVASGVYELRSQHVATDERATAGAVPVAPADYAAVRQTPFRLEVSNGNGVQGAARQVGERLVLYGAPAAHLTNERPYNRLNTVVYFNRGFENEARRLQQVLGAASGGPVIATYPRADVRIAIGRDMLPGLNAERDGKRTSKRATS
jgi:tetratricopeptide (TPR) repeat protein